MKERVLVAMSGGIDSSVAAIMLHEQGYEVVGITMKTWDYKNVGGSRKETGCCSLDSINDARNVAVKYDFPHIILDLKEEFGDRVISNFIDEYVSGRTPNPCVLCNTYIKWDALLARADKLGCSYIATGHYAKVRLENGRYVISKGKDLNKDQSYALWGVSQTSLSRTMLPLGTFSKSEIRQIAYDRGFSNLAKKSESYEICFIPDNDYRGFLKRKVSGLADRVKGGDFVLKDGTIVGKHDGYPFYTIGQRKGLGVALGYPVYVVDINAHTNTIILGELDELAKDGMYVDKISMVKYPNLPKDAFFATTKIRYNDPGTDSIISYDDNGCIKVVFNSDVIGITPGQAAVFYEDDDVVGGGWIESSFRERVGI